MTEMASAMREELSLLRKAMIQVLTQKTDQEDP